MGIPLLVAVLHIHAVVADVLEPAGSVLLWFVEAADSHVAICGVDSTKHLVALLRRVKLACQVLLNVSINADNQVAIREAGDIPLLVAMLLTYPGSASLTRAACEVLSNVAANADNRAAIREAGGARGRSVGTPAIRRCWLQYKAC